MAQPKAIRLFSIGVQIVTAICVIAYPFAVYFGLKFWSLNQLIPLLITIFCLRFILIKGQLAELTWLLRVITLIAIFLLLTGWILKQNQWLLFYPVLINGLFLLLFSYSLFKPPSIIERLARIKTPDLPPKGILYTKKVTQVWCLFFVINGSIATWTCFQESLYFWTLYNGMISYLLMGILFASEWLIRQWFMKQH